MKRLITGFEPFLTHQENPTMAITEALKSELVDTQILPVEYETAADLLITHLKTNTYDAILLLGLAGNRTKISIEHHAINLMDAFGADNRGVIKRFEPITSSGPDTYLTKLPFKPIIEDAEKLNYPVELSLSAGAYICNDVFYRLRHAYPDQMIGFIHVPPTDVIPIDEQIQLITWISDQLNHS